MRNKTSNALNKNARDLRHDATKAERLLWQRLRKYKLDGLKFRRQEPVGKYIVDFICIEKHLVIELDGGGHWEEQQAKHDAERTDFLKTKGLCVVRFANTDVLKNIDGVLQVIQEACI